MSLSLANGFNPESPERLDGRLPKSRELAWLDFVSSSSLLMFFLPSLLQAIRVYAAGYPHAIRYAGRYASHAARYASHRIAMLSSSILCWLAAGICTASLGMLSRDAARDARDAECRAQRMRSNSEQHAAARLLSNLAVIERMDTRGQDHE